MPRERNLGSKAQVPESRGYVSGCSEPKYECQEREESVSEEGSLRAIMDGSLLL